MEITVSVDAARPLALLRNGSKRMAFAVVNALNHTAKEIQKGELARVRSEFTVRKHKFIAREAAVIRGAGGGSGFANVKQGRFEVRIAVGQKPRLLLSDFEAGGTKRPFKGRKVAVPLTGGPARPSFGQAVPEAFMFRGLKLRRVRGGVKGAHRTFILKQTARAPQGGVFQRVGPGRGDIRMVYSFAPAPRLDRRLRFIQTGEAIANRVYAAALAREVDAAFSYALRGVGR